MRKGLTKMNDAVHSTLKDWLVLALAGIGVQFPPHHYIGGLLLAMAGAAVATKFQPDEDRVELWTVIVTAWVIATIAAIGGKYYMPDFPPQVVMAAAGFFSRYIARLLLAMAGRVEAQTDTIFDRLLDRVLPKRGGGQ